MKHGSAMVTTLPKYSYRNGGSTLLVVPLSLLWWHSAGSYFLVNLLAVNGLFEMHEEISEPTEMTQVNESKYSSETDSREKVTEDYDGSG